MKKMILFVLAGAMLSVASGAVQAADCCCPKKSWTMPKLLPRLKSLGRRTKCASSCTPAAPCCSATATVYESAPTPPPVETAPKPGALTPSAAEQPKK